MAAAPLAMWTVHSTMRGKLLARCLEAVRVKHSINTLLIRLPPSQGVTGTPATCACRGSQGNRSTAKLMKLQTPFPNSTLSRAIVNLHAFS